MGLNKRSKPNAEAQTQPHSINWPDLTFMAEANGEGFAEANIVTLRAHYREKVYEMAFDRAAKEGVTVDKIFSTVEDYAIDIMRKGTVKVQPFVEVFDSYITICIDEPKVDDEAVQKALNMLLEVDELTPGKRYDLGSAVSFQPEEAELRPETLV